MFARLSKQKDGSEVATNVLSLYSMPTPLSGWLTVTFDATDINEGYGTWYYRLIPQGQIPFNDPVAEPVPFEFPSIHVGQQHQLDPSYAPQKTLEHQIKVTAKSFGGAGFAIQLLRSDSEIKEHWGADSQRYKDYQAKKLGEVFDKSNTKYLVRKELKLSLSALRPDVVPVEHNPAKDQPKA